MIFKAREKSTFAKTISFLRNGGVVIAPTETCYGMLADATNSAAVEKIYGLKRRQKAKAVSVFVYGGKMARNYFKLNKNAVRLMEKFMPGPLTIVVQKKTGSKLARNLSESDSIGFRISSNPFISKLVRAYGKPLTATSANVSGKGEIYSFSEAKKHFSGKDVLLVDGGVLARVPPSTVVDCTKRKIKILREGAIHLRLLE